MDARINEEYCLILERERKLSALDWMRERKTPPKDELIQAKQRLWKEYRNIASLLQQQGEEPMALSAKKRGMMKCLSETIISLNPCRKTKRRRERLVVEESEEEISIVESEKQSPFHSFDAEAEEEKTNEKGRVRFIKSNLSHHQK